MLSVDAFDPYRPAVTNTNLANESLPKCREKSLEHKKRNKVLGLCFFGGFEFFSEFVGFVCVFPGEFGFFPSEVSENRGFLVDGS